MNLDSILNYLNDDLFSGGLNIKVATRERDVLYRIPFLDSLVRNKRIIHVGCVDHVALFEKKLESDNWLHKILSNSSLECIGIDIDVEGIAYIKDKGYQDVYCLDMIKDDVPFFLKNKQWDYMILGEILEHIDNPVSFLTILRHKYSEIVRNFIITVPNAYTYMNLKALYRNVEIINTNHRYWFTPYTLGKVCIKSGFKIDSFYFARKSTIKSFFPFKKIFFSFFPVLRDTIIMILKP
jgi:hypothetical protein